MQSINFTYLKQSAVLGVALFVAGTSVAKADLNVAVSIKPIHSLVYSVMEGISTPDLIVEAGSPHTYSLKPSQAKQLEEADVVFWVDHNIESFLEKPLEAIATNARSVELGNTLGLIKLTLREGITFDSHGHAEHAKEEHDDHRHVEHAKEEHDDHGLVEHVKEEHDEHGHVEHAKEEHDDHGHVEYVKKEHDDHGHGNYNPHVWLDPVNAKVMVHKIAETLVELDPVNASRYKANAYNLEAELDLLTTQVGSELEAVKGKGFVVFHDAYHYFENRFGMTALGSITISPEVLPGAARVKELREKVKALKAMCVFSEPQFKPKLVATIIEGTNVGSGVLDPLGATIDAGPKLYFKLMQNMSASLRECLLTES
jgi:zinc transport system substrate-binding protein